MNSLTPGQAAYQGILNQAIISASENSKRLSNDLQSAKLKDQGALRDAETLAHVSARRVQELESILRESGTPVAKIEPNISVEDIRQEAEASYQRVTKAAAEYTAAEKAYAKAKEDAQKIKDRWPLFLIVLLVLSPIIIFIIIPIIVGMIGLIVPIIVGLFEIATG